MNTASTVVRSLSRVALRSTNIIRMTAPRHFSQSTKMLSVTPELQQALSREIEAEQQLSKDNLQGDIAPTFPGFQVLTKDAEVRLTKKNGAEDILVVFNVNHSVDMEEGFDDEPSQAVAPVPVALPPFTVEITKGDQRLCFHLELVPVDDQPDEYDFRVEEFYVAPSAKNGNEDVPSEVYASSGKYIDPDLHDLLFVRYLEERGLDARFCKTLVAYATHYEHSHVQMAEEQVQEFKLKEDCELRFAAGDDADVCLELVHGYAEVFGTELILNKKYIFPAKSRVAVFTWKSAVIELVGPTESAYVAEQTPMVVYLNTHAAMEQVRQNKETQAHNSGTKAKGPRMLLVGPTDVGKSTVSRILCNYAVRQGRTPIYVELDVGQNNISVPGTVGAVLVQKTADVVDGFERNNPIVFNFGYTSPSKNLSLYEALFKQLASTINNQIQEHDEARISGMIINTCGWVDGEGYKCLVKAASAFEVDVVVVLDHERLYSDLSKELPEFVRLVHQPKSGGVEQRTTQIRSKMRGENVHRYFYGTRANNLFPFTFDVNFDDVILCKIGAEQLPESCLPIGMEIENHETKVVVLEPSVDIKHHLFAFSPAQKADENVLKSAVYGFCLVTEVDMEKRTFSILSPQNSLPSKTLVYSEITHLDDQVQR
ncbi:unnamed protein product [Caenorhabditis sp. 36 PRJEB53466]|nr:unnamed protein product [Caenorhabditis sp. 36 PRJEB53466]